MISAKGLWYDGKSSKSIEATITILGNDRIKICRDGLELSFLLQNIKIDPPLGKTVRIIRFPTGEVIETSDNNFVTKIHKRQGKGRFFRVVHNWEASLTFVLLAVVLILVVSFCFVRYATPVIAKQAAFAIPVEAEELLGHKTLEILDSAIMKPSKLSATRKKQLTVLFNKVKTTKPENNKNWRLEFRSGDAIGANAFALPSGVVIVTDRLVEIAANDNQISSVMAHEIGHLSHRHALRSLIQNSGVALLIATITGDIVSITSLSATLPTAMISAKYSRDFEVEADDTAIEYFRKNRLPLKDYADLLTNITNDHKKDYKNSPISFGEVFSDHPLTEKRIQRILSEK